MQHCSLRMWAFISYARNILFYGHFGMESVPDPSEGRGFIPTKIFHVNFFVLQEKGCLMQMRSECCPFVLKKEGLGPLNSH